MIKQSTWNMEGLILLLTLFLQVIILLALRWFGFIYNNQPTHIHANLQHVLVIWLGLVITVTVHVATVERFVLVTVVLFAINLLCLHNHYLSNFCITTEGRIFYCAIIAIHFGLCSVVSTRYRSRFPIMTNLFCMLNALIVFPALFNFVYAYIIFYAGGWWI